MLPNVIDIHDIENGVDRKQLSLLKQRFVELNQQRHHRTCTGLSERQQQFLQLLPLLFHVNHPMLPGYVSHQTACGVYHYKPDKNEIRLAKTWARSFHFNHDLIANHPAVDAIFVMGSVGTIAQSDSSDLDIWICHNDNLSTKSVTELQAKCQKLHLWAEQSIHLEAHFFLMTGQTFQQRKTTELSSEDSGSAQHFLLLDEFYRTAVWLAGKVPLWWFVPASQEENYEHYSKNLLAKRFVRDQDVIDFGGIPNIPPNEFIGAGIWQLYKGIEAPYKSVLKLLLLETYAGNVNSEPLALTFKRSVYNGTIDASLLDPYVMIYQRLEHHLMAHAQLLRLELVRRSFYFKVNKPLTKNNRNTEQSWQKQLLEQLVAHWGWPLHYLQTLDNRASWKAPDVIAERTLLVNELASSYRLLTELHKNSFAEAAISNDELMILGRKLHAAFERKAGKIEWINPGISRDLSEATIYAHHEKEENQDRWNLYCVAQHELATRITSTEPIKRSRNLMELLLWAYCNGLITDETKLEISNQQLQFSNMQRQHLLQILQQWLPLPLAQADHDLFKQNTRTTRLLLLFNVGVEPQTELHKKGMQILSNQSDALGYSGFKENLALTADIIQINSWQEIVCRRYDSDALINSLLHYLRMLPPGRGLPLPQLTIRCLSASQGNTIAQRLEELWRDIIACYYSGTRPSNTRYILEVGSEYLLLQFLQQQPHITRYRSYEKLLEKLGNAQLDHSPIIIDRYAMQNKTLKLFCSVATTPGIYVFFQAPGTHDEKAKVCIIDEKGSLFTSDMPYYNQQTLLRPLQHFISAVMARKKMMAMSGVDTLQLPVFFYEVLGNVKQQQGYLEERPANGDIHWARIINIYAIAEPDRNGEIHFNIYCNGKEFSLLEHQDKIYRAVAQHIVQLRGKQEHYPCYITDLDLSLCANEIAPQSGLQLSHYLKVKKILEEKLNLEINQLKK
jgi:adenylate cyclase class 1